MNHRAVHLALLVAAAGGSACGKSSTDPGSTEPKVAESATANAAPVGGGSGAVTAKPNTPPVKAASRGDERVAYSLVDNRLAAHVSRGGGLVLPGGSAGFAKYTRFANVMKDASKKPWELRQSEGTTKVARIRSKTATVFVPLTAAQAGRSMVRARFHTKEAGTLSVRVNENKDINKQIAAGWSTVDVEVPAGQLVEGENSIQLYLKGSGAALAWLQVGASAKLTDEEAVTFYDPAQKALLVPKDGQMSWFVSVPDKAKLTGDLADGSCGLSVFAAADDGATVEGKLSGTGSAVDLSALAGKAVRLDLEATGCPQVALSNAALVVPGAVPMVKRGDAPKFVLFIIMDSLRADRLRAINPKARPESPNFDKLAESSAVFMQHFVQGNESQVSHASMWTSMYLAKHKSPNMADKLPDRWTTIDEVAKKAGKFVAGASANGYIRPNRGYGSGWDKYINHIEKSLGLRGTDIVEKGVAFITPTKDQPWFLYLGLIDTHVTWRAKKPWIDKYDGGYKGRFETQFGDDGPGGFPKDLTDREKDHVRALYDSNVSYQDDLLGKLIEKLQGWGIYDQTMIIITADHGDEQWEDGKIVGHARTQRQTLIHVPLIIHYPPMFPPSKVQSGTEGIDIVPTLADALGVTIDPEWQGMSLIGLANGLMPYPLLASSSQYENFHGGRIGNWKVRLSGTGAPQIYNLAKDPGEKKDLWGTQASSIGARLLLDPMGTLRSGNVEWKKSQWGSPAAVSSRFAADLGE